MRFMARQRPSRPARPTARSRRSASRSWRSSSSAGRSRSTACSTGSRAARSPATTRARFADIDQEALAALIGIGQAIKNREITAEQAFPVKTAAAAGVSRGDALDALAEQMKAKKSKSEHAPANDATVPLTIPQVIDALADADESWDRITTA